MQSKTLQRINIFSNNILAGEESLNWHPLVSDFILLARKLEKLEFIYHRGSVIIVKSEEHEVEHSLNATCIKDSIPISSRQSSMEMS
jgi:hypothetical protein